LSHTSNLIQTARLSRLSSTYLTLKCTLVLGLDTWNLWD